MKNWILFISIFVVIGWLVLRPGSDDATSTVPDGREEVVFWHFWGGSDREVVDGVVQRFNESQSQYFVRAIPMPGNNLQAKLFLSIAGGDPPDLVNQDDPIVGDWASRGAILALDEIIPEEEVAEINEWLFPSAQRLGTYDDRLYAVCNGLDIRALYYNLSALNEHGLAPPTTTDDLDRIATTIAPPGASADRRTFGYLPDSRRLWAWGYVFGGNFYDVNAHKAKANDPAIVAALQWMTSYSKLYGPDAINAFRQGDQSLPGKTFPLLPVSDDEMIGRYAVLMDGQWRTRDIRKFVDRRQSRNLPTPEFGVCPLPVPDGGRERGGWVNGNIFIIPKSSKSPRGAVEFMKFWIGMHNPSDAAETCRAGGWIPVSETVVNDPTFQEFLQQEPLFAEFVELAASENQFPVPVIPGAPFFKRTIEQVAEQGMSDVELSTSDLLDTANDRIQARLDQESGGER